ncbi:MULTISPECIES: homoserine kinase [unclassified Mesorhizobium]|uniref:homoserine kinase n=1 Tax=unclassified Mesorhizobium TaxID=325217 RepID=UPI00112B74C0|nr:MULTISPECIES: homoserine kinase [unclassified Mesorhizobium]MBZ9894325.1 homoserine kinase [Mesorhizobium sp. BR1-1-6]TPM57715.1 homoserine kinase [Mesorhizobium sp. B2-2-4]TPM65482.1 homoserine kinase [Mesorhizobium sp. B2-2-1]TPN38608.1 homoserine kinase [Mesorhizobium sp. B1-1-6]TPN71808.1 homoserine kinase [Mesorhizobium sp. B1-1-3]
MAVYTKLSFDEVAAFFGELGLGWPRSVRGITTGIENTNYFVDAETGEYVLTLFERLTFEQLPFYLHFIKHLAARRLPVPDPVANVKGEILHSLKDRPAVVVNRLPGESVTAPTVSHCRSIGETLARIHLAGTDYPRHQVNPRGLEWWNEVVPVVGRWVSEEQCSLLTRELAFQNQIAQSSTYRQLPKGPVHADLFRDNVLFDGGQLTGVFDFYFAGCDAFLFDIAVCLNDWCVDDCTGSQDGERAAAFLGAYESVRTLTPAERILLPAMQRAGAFRFWLSRLWDLHQPREAAILKAHDPSHCERMLRVHRGEIA